MKKITKITLILFSLIFFRLKLATLTWAVCPVCTIAIGAGLGLSRFLGVDDTVSGIWIGGILISSSFWLADWFEKKIKKQIKYKVCWAALLMYAITLIPLYSIDIVGHPLNKIFGIDKLIFGSLVGTIVFLGAVWLEKRVRQMAKKQFFNFQKVVFPVSALIIASVVLYFATKIY